MSEDAQYKIQTYLSNQIKNYNKTLNNMIKFNSFKPFNIEAYNFADTIKPIKLDQSFKNFADSLKIPKYDLDFIKYQNDIIQSSIQPFQEQIERVREMISKTLEVNIPKIDFEFLNNLKEISSYAPEFVESIDNSLFIDTVNAVYESIDSFDTYTDSNNEVKEYKDIFSFFIELINNSPLTKDNFYSFVGLIMNFFMLIQPYLDNSTDAIIDNQKAIIELQKEQLEVDKDIRDSLKEIQNSSSNADVVIQNINDSLDTFIKSVEK